MPTQRNVLHALAAAWAGQPDLTIAQLLTQIENHHGGPGANDEEFLDACLTLAKRYPARLPNELEHQSAYHVHTSAADVLINSAWVAVMPHESTPSMWRYHTIVESRVGETLRVTDSERNAYAYGTVLNIRPGSQEQAIVKTTEAIVAIRPTGAEAWIQSRRATDHRCFELPASEFIQGEHLRVDGVDLGTILGILEY